MFKKRIVCTMVVVAMLVLALSVGAQAVAADGGSVELTNAEVTPLEVREVGGGWWNFGTAPADNGEKKLVWSNYLHYEKVHRSSCVLGPAYDGSPWTPPGDWSESSLVGDPWLTGYAYWDTQD